MCACVGVWPIGGAAEEGAGAERLAAGHRRAGGGAGRGGQGAGGHGERELTPPPLHGAHHGGGRQKVRWVHGRQ